MLKPLLMALLVVAGPIQAQFLYVCSVDQAQMPCCEGHGIDMIVSPDCDMHTDAEPPCMDLAAIDTQAQSARSLAPSFDRGIDKMPSTPVAILPFGFDLAVPPRPSPLITAHSPVYPGAAGTQTYLVTQRLRI